MSFGQGDEDDTRYWEDELKDANEIAAWFKARITEDTDEINHDFCAWDIPTCEIEDAIGMGGSVWTRYERYYGGKPKLNVQWLKY